jgi:predicted hydrolase (HD superfamily)
MFSVAKYILETKRNTRHRTIKKDMKTTNLLAMVERHVRTVNIVRYCYRSTTVEAINTAS